jgi:type I restriction enzyme S subunit
MSSEWQITSLGALTNWMSGGTPKKDEPKYWNGDIPWISANSMHGSRYTDSDLRLTVEGLNSGSRLAPRSSVLLLVRGGALHSRIPVGMAMRDVAFNQDVKALVPKTVELRPWYLLYWLMGMEQYLLNSVVEYTGIGAGKLDTKRMQGLDFLLPPIPEQDAVVSVIKSLDDRITLLRETNATLEAIAQAIFKSWFVDFDPVRAKQEGRAPEGMDDATAALFPDSFEESALGLVPRGWRVGTVADLGEVICGKTPPTSNPENYGNEIPFITIPDMHDLLVVTATNRSLSRLGADSQKKKYLPPGAICVSCIATPGLVVRVTASSQTNQQINSVVPIDSWGRSFPLFLLRRIGDAVRAGGSGGSVFHNLSKSGFEELPVLLTAPVIAQAFDEVVEPLVARIEETQHQTQTLAALRDTLLPRLISGQLRLPDTEDAIAEVVA